MKMVNIMNYKMCLYALTLLMSVFILSGINIEKFMKRGKEIEAKLLVMTLACMMSYLLTNFVWDFLNL